VVWVGYQSWAEYHCQIYYPVPVRILCTKRWSHSLDAVMRFLSDFRANTDKRSRTYKRRYWFARGMLVISFLYVETTSSWLNGCFAVTWNQKCILPARNITHLKHPGTRREISKPRMVLKIGDLRGGTYHVVLQVPAVSNEESTLTPKQSTQITNGHLGEISSEDACNIMCRIVFLLPVQ
jgi:hypothetical protein